MRFRKWMLGICLLLILLGWEATSLADMPSPLPVEPNAGTCDFPYTYFGGECYVIDLPEPPGGLVQEIDQTGYVKALYITYYGLASAKLMPHVQTLLETTELNAVVIDVKGDRGKIPYRSQVQTAIDIGAANDPVLIKDWPAMMRWFQERNIYTIARIVMFKDEPLAAGKPEWAVIDGATDEVWRDKEGLGWTDPSREEVWDYNIALAVEAAEWGFDEIQFDYIRFPSDGDLSQTQFAIENTEANRVASIVGFLARADEALASYEVKIGMDTFGYTPWRQDDMGIGQKLELVAPYLDVISPMLYPSTFADGLPGLPGYENAIAFPYEIVYESTWRAVQRTRASNPNIIVRPWIQDFPDYAFDRRVYTPQDIRLQMEAARQAGGRGWMLWDPRMGYTEAALTSAFPQHPPNPAGQVLVLEYHRIGEPEGRWQRTPANFRADLERLLAGGYYPINLRDLLAGNLTMVPAGKKPIVLTFDDSTIGQFRLLPDGQIDPDSAVGILKAFHEAQPADWPMRATFFVLQGPNGPAHNTFGQAEWAQQKLEMLVDWGMEVGSHTISHARLNELDPLSLSYELGRSQHNLEAALPGYEVVSLSVPYGLYPNDLSVLMAGEYQNQPYGYQAVVEVAGGFNPPPHAASFNPYRILRVQAIQSELDWWLGKAGTEGVYYVSAGE